MSKKIIYELRDMFDKQKGTQGNKKNITKNTKESTMKYKSTQNTLHTHTKFFH